MKIALFCLLLCAAAPQSGRAAEIHGRTVDSITGTAIKGVRIRLRFLADGTRLTTVTDDAGAFQFAGLPAGPYGLQSEHPDFVRGFGHGRSAALQSIVDLTATETRTVELRLVPNGGVEGVVLTESGGALARCDVELLQSEYRQGETRLAGQEHAATDDRGQFRLTNVTPGTYRMRTTCEPNPIPFRPLSPETGEHRGSTLGFAVSLPPDVITVNPGAASSGIVVTMRETMLYPLEGAVTLPAEAASAESTQVLLMPEEDDGTVTAGTVLARGETSFRLPGASAGRYVLVAFANASDALFTAHVQTTVGEHTGRVTADLVPGATLTGAIEITQRNAGVREPITGALLPVATRVLPPRTFTPGTDGRFDVAGVSPGIWRLSLSAPDLFVQSVTIADRDLASPQFAVSGPATIAMRVVLSDGVGTIEGTVREPASQPRPVERTIAVEPLFTPAFLNDDQQVATVGIDGHYTIGGLPPGEYRIFALPLMDTEVALHPELHRALAAYADVVTVQPGTTVAKDVRPATEEAVAAALLLLSNGAHAK
jgi:hypothetical protein